MDWHILLVISAAIFGAFVVFRFRPLLGSPRVDPARRAAVREAKARVREARAPADRAAALSDLAEASAAAKRPTAAMGYYLRAMRLAPAEAAFIERMAIHLATQPRAVEAILCRRLASSAWTGDTRAAAVAALRHLHALYTGRLRSSVRARAI